MPGPPQHPVVQESGRQGPPHDGAAPGVPDQSPVAAVPGTPRAARPRPFSPGPAHQPVCPQLPPKRDETALQEEEELQLALALSQSEAEEKERMVSGEEEPEAALRGELGEHPLMFGEG